MFRKPIRAKYGNKRVEKAGIWFDSKAESKHHDDMLLRERAGEIKILKLQDRVHLTAGIHLKVDFKIFDVKLDQEVWEEFKGFETKEWRLKKKLWKEHGPGLLRVYYTNRRTEEIWPKAKVEK